MLILTKKTSEKKIIFKPSINSFQSSPRQNLLGADVASDERSAIDGAVQRTRKVAIGLNSAALIQQIFISCFSYHVDNQKKKKVF